MLTWNYPLFPLLVFFHLTQSLWMFGFVLNGSLIEDVSEIAEYVVMWHYECRVSFTEGKNEDCFFFFFFSTLYWMFDYCCDVVTGW